METSAAVDSGWLPAAGGCTEVGSHKEELDVIHGKDAQKLPELPPEKINWITTIPELTHHLATLYVLKLVIEGRIGLASITLCLLLAYLGLLGTTIGAHRLWSHRSFKANKPVRYIALAFASRLLSSILHWVTWHRVHHKYSDTELDPHNASRGFFYSHIGWLLMYNPKRFAVQQSLVNLDDLESDPVVVWQDTYYDWLVLIGGFGFAAIPWWFFGEDYILSFYTCVCARATLNHNVTFAVNSFAHLYGLQPYDRNIYPREKKIVSWFAAGEGWHNYPNTFPWDYRTSEFGWTNTFNPSSAIIDFCASMGWAYDLKTASPKLVAARTNRTGDTRAYEGDRACCQTAT